MTNHEAEAFLAYATDKDARPELIFAVERALGIDWGEVDRQ